VEVLSWDRQILARLSTTKSLSSAALAQALWPEMSYRVGDYRLPQLEETLP
jgi:hypothetical protein